jgi:ELWxxDGT repeat protein
MIAAIARAFGWIGLCGLLFALHAPTPPPARAASASPTLVADLSTGTQSSNPQPGISFNGSFYFAADDGVHGSELWRTDGSAAGTSMVRDLNPGTEGSYPRNFFVWNNALYYTSLTGDQYSLWRDGSANPVFTLSAVGYLPKFYPDHQPPIDHLTASNGQLFFSISTNRFLCHDQLWRSDGTAAARQLVFAFISEENYGPDQCIEAMIEAGGMIYMARYRSNASNQVWRSDGTQAGTIRLMSFPDTGYFGGFSALNGQAYFLMSGKLWRSEGSAATTQVVWAPTTNHGSYELVTYAGQLFFEHNEKIWRSDGTQAGTQPFFVAPSDANFSKPLFSDGQLYILVFRGARQDIWHSDGSVDGTTLLTSLAIDDFLGVNAGRLYFAIEQPEIGTELFIDNGPNAATLVRDINAAGNNSRIQAHTILPRSLLFGTKHSLPVYDQGYEGIGTVWGSDGTANGTLPIFSEQGTLPPPIYRNYAILSAMNGFYRSDGTPAGTTRFASDNITPAVVAGEWIYFVSERQLMRSNGTPEGTSAVPQAPTIVHAELIADGNDLLFVSIDQPSPEAAVELWRVSGTTGSATRIFRFPNANTFTSLGALPDGTIMLIAGTASCSSGRGGCSISDAMLWVSDGSATGTSILAPLERAGYGDAIQVGERLLFRHRASDSYFSSDGTLTGTIRLGFPRLVSSTVVDGVLYGYTYANTWPASDPPYTETFWRSDGTLAGTRLIYRANWFCQGLTSLGGMIYFGATDQRDTTEPVAKRCTIYRYDGTSVQPSTAPFFPAGMSDFYPLGVNEQGLFFQAKTYATGSELWRITGSDSFVSGPVQETLDPAAPGFVALDVGNTLVDSDASLQLTITLDPGLRYLGNSWGLTPTVNGNQLSFALPRQGALWRRAFGLQLALPANAPLGSRYPLSASMSAAANDSEPNNNRLDMTVVAARRLYAPLIR